MQERPFEKKGPFCRKLLASSVGTGASPAPSGWRAAPTSPISVSVSVVSSGAHYILYRTMQDGGEREELVVFRVRMMVGWEDVSEHKCEVSASFKRNMKATATPAISITRTPASSAPVTVPPAVSTAGLKYNFLGKEGKLKIEYSFTNTIQMIFF
jgi:hypothetical protein